jgi:putative ABC transport system permease protein
MIDFARMLRRMRTMLGRGAFERDLDDEIAFHIAAQTERNIALGYGPSEARRLAEREFGSRARYKDDVRDVRGLTLADDIGRDVRVSMRSFRRTPAFTAVAVLTLALGIGATTAIFSVVNGVLLRPLPFDAPDRLVSLYERGERFDRMAPSAPNVADWQAQSRSFEAIAAYRGGATPVLGLEAGLTANVAAVGRDFFTILRVSPYYGRAFTAEESRAGSAATAVVSYAFWQKYLAGTRTLGARPLAIWGTAFTIVGVMPPGFAYPERADIWFPLEPFNEGMGRSSHNDEVIARLAPGVTLAQARGDLETIAKRLREQYGKGTNAIGASVFPLQDELVGSVKTYLRMLLFAVVFVLLVACVNLASANLARGAARRREMAIRTALGAGRARLIRQLLTENVLLAVTGGLVGLVLARWLVGVLLALAPRTLPRADTIGIDGAVLVFTLVVSVLTGVVIGIIPALQAGGADVRTALSGGRGEVSSRRGELRRWLVGAEVALALVLLVGAGLLVRSFATLLGEDLGLDPRNVLTVAVELPASTYGEPADKARYYTAALAAVGSVPGVQQAALINIVPLSREGFGSGVVVEGRSDDPRYADYRLISADYFRTMRIPLVSGRVFTDADDSTATHVTVINQAMAEQFFPGQNPIGQRIKQGGMDAHRDIWMTIVGVVGDVRRTGLTKPAGPQQYIHYKQRPERGNFGTLVVRTAGPPAMVTGAIRDRLRALDVSVTAEMATMIDVRTRSVADRRFAMLVLSGFGTVALLLAAIGIYGVLSYSVARRAREIGVRMALGAARSTVVGMVLRDSMMPVAMGVVVGIVGSLGLTRLMQGLLYGVGTTDPTTFAAVTAVLGSVALLASYLPAYRASRIDPMIAMRAE